MKCTKCNVVILQSTSDRNEGKCQPCAGGRKKMKGSPFSRNVDRPQNWWEVVIAFTVIVPFIFALLTGGYVGHLFRIDDINIPRDWNGIDFLDILKQVIWVPFAILYIRLWGYLIYFFKILPKDRAKKFPFGAELSND